MRKKRTWKIAATVFFALITFVFLYFNILESMELWYGDHMYMQETAINNKIKIIGIDDASLEAIGPYQTWTRQEYANLIESLVSEDSTPAVIGFDINVFGNMDEEKDAAFAEQAARVPVVMASYVEFQSKLERDSRGNTRINSLYPKRIETSYTALDAVTEHGFTDTIQDSDNYVRRALLSVDMNGETEYNFAYKVYENYCESTGVIPEKITTESNGIYGFNYSSSPGGYEKYSFVDVLNKKVPPELFDGCIVLVGAYASGMMDQFITPTTENGVMNGVEVHANNLNAMIENRTYTNVGQFTNAAVGTLIILVFVLNCIFGVELSVKLMNFVTFETFAVMCAKVLYGRGIYVRSFTVCLFIILIFLATVGFSYMSEAIHKRDILETFRKYIAPQVVDEFAKDQNYSIELGGEERDIAVLFVDIRGFTTLSEEMSPSQIVDILNHYLSMVTDEVFEQGGTLDKFIGDAVMAVYNAPIAVPDYCKKAVKTALAIQAGMQKVNEQVQEYGKKIEVGVGIHTGKSTVGNIGCNYRVDYTAIGDTVNTASRLEGSAAPGEILISSDVYEQIKDSYEATYVDEIALKGKKRTVKTYRVIGLKQHL